MTPREVELLRLNALLPGGMNQLHIWGAGNYQKAANGRRCHSHINLEKSQGTALAPLTPASQRQSHAHTHAHTQSYDRAGGCAPAPTPPSPLPTSSLCLMSAISGIKSVNHRPL